MKSRGLRMYELIKARSVQLGISNILSIFTITGISFCLRQLLPGNIVLNSPHDDLLGVQIADSILKGEWLGGWTNRTFLKPIGFSLYLVFTKTLSINPIFLIWLGFLILSWVISGILVNESGLSLKHQKSARNFIYGLFALNPNLFSSDMNRLYRTSLNTVCLFAVIVLFLRIYVDHKQMKSLKPISIDYSKYRKKAILNFSTLGILYFFAYSTRTESFWLLYPFIIIGLIVYILENRRNQKKRKIKFKKMNRIYLLGLTIGILTFSVPYFVILSLNSQVYGAPIFENYTKGNFSKTINLWQSVENGRSGNVSTYISSGQREAVYQISDTATQLKPFLETNPGSGWKTNYCQITGDCNEFGGAWLPFALRDAAVQAGGIQNETQFQNYFGQLYAEIKIACDRKRIICGHLGSAAGVPYIGDLRMSSLIQNMFNLSKYYFSDNQNYYFNLNDPSANPELVALWKNTTGLNPYQVSKISVLALQRYSSLYSYLLVMFTSFSLLSLVLKFKKSIAHSLSRFNIPTILSLLLFISGISVLEIAWGFNPTPNLYLLPGLPIFLTFISINFLVALKCFLEDKESSNLPPKGKN